jgi:hypothetical protein
MATEGDVFAKGTKYKAATYDFTNSCCKGKNHPSRFGHPYSMVADINVEPTDCNLPLYAPEDGTVTIDSSTGGWGKSIMWTNGAETLFLAHLNNFGATGSVDSGKIIGYLGSTGIGTGCHLHIESSLGWLELSGKIVVPTLNPPGNGKQYTSKGPISGGGGGSLSLDKLQGSKEGKDDWENSFELSMDDIYDMDFRAKLVQEDGAWPSDTEAFFYLSLDKDLDSGDIFLGSEERDLTGENAKKRSIYLEDVDMSDYITSPGTYYVLTRVKFDGGEEESSSGDSEQRVKLIVYDVPVPDLTLSALHLNNSSTTLSGQEFYGMTVSMQNVGEAAAENRFRIKYEISGPDVADQWRLIADAGFDSVPLVPGNDQLHSTNDSFSAAPVAEGEYRLRACVDYKEAVPESNEGNNCTEMTVSVSSTPATLKPVYRFWSTKNSSHFYTINEDEKDYVIDIYTDYEWKYEGIAWYAYDVPHDDALPIYRFWSAKNRSHFYTISEEEKDGVIAKYTDYEWKYECIESYAYDYQKEGTVPVYRFWSAKNRSHFYTISEEEKDGVIAKYTDYEWKYEGIAWYVYPTPTALNPVYRFYSKKNRSHFYTISTSEKNDLILNNAPESWEYESVGWFSYRYQQGDTLPVYRFWSKKNTAHFYTISEEEKNAVIDKYTDYEWKYEGAAFYAYKNQEVGTLPVYRFWSNIHDAHFYTASEGEKDNLITDYPDVWEFEKEAWYVPLNP